MMSLEKLVADWNPKGREEALALFVKAVGTDSISTEPQVDNLEFRTLLYELLKLATTNRLVGADLVDFTSKLTSNLDIKNDLPSILSDLLAVLDAETATSDSKEQRISFESLASQLTKLIGEPLLKERLEMDTLETVRLIPSARNFNQKYVKTKTKLFYKQQKFNLFCEENEGYSKLMVELGHEQRPVSAAPVMLDNIRSLIGRFNLDPNRVLDLILEAFESHLDQKDFFLSLLESYPCEKNTFVNILGFRFHRYQSTDVVQVSPTPASLYTLSALLLHCGLVKLGDFYPHLSQSDSKLTELQQSSLEDAQTRAKRANIVSFAEKSEETLQKEAEAEEEKRLHRQHMLSLEHNQKLGLCHALLELGDWNGACSLLKLLPPYLAVWSTAITKSLCSLVSLSIEPLYRNYCSRAVKGQLRSSSPGDNELIKTCSKMEDLFPVVFDMLCHIGPHMHSDPILMAKLLRLGRIFFKERASIRASGELVSQERESVFQGFLTILDEVLLPSLCQLPSNCGMAEEVWAMVKHLPYQNRYQLYGRWKNESFQFHPDLLDAKTDTLTRAKFIMKRITIDNIKPSGRQIGKLSHSFPGVIFDYVLSQIQRYDNFISPVVDSLKYLTPLGYDVLAYCIIEALGSPQKERMKYNDTNISQWLKGLSSFCSNIFKKYSIELTGLLQYVANQLKAEKSVDLLVLKEVIVKMAGIDITEQVTDQQLEALAGGELLKAEGAYYAQVRNTKKSCQRLREALVDANLSLPLILLMAQQRDCIVYRDGTTRHLKLVGMLYDNCLDTLVQFGEFLSVHTSPEEYSSRIPRLNELLLDYYIPVDVAFFMLRPVLQNVISKKFLELEKTATSESDKLDKKAKAARQEANYQTACQQVLEPIVEAAKQVHPAKVWDDISCKLYTAFWMLSTYDLYVPSTRYEEEMGRAKQTIKDLENSSELANSKKKKEQERNSVLIEKLHEERQRQEDNCRLVMSWIKKEKDAWFNPRVAKNRTITQFLQLCVFPRCRFTALDALFCAKFVCTLHSQQTPNFSTLLFFDRMFSDISYTVSCCTENEAMRYGRFLGALLETVSRWHLDESAYDQECAKTPGFISMMRASGAGNEKQDLDYQNYRHITFKWHFKLTKSFVILLESKDYLQLRNGLYVLTKMVPYYPKVYHLSIALEKRIEKIMEEEKDKRQDLYTLAIGYAGKLKLHKPNLIPESEFHIREERVKAQQSDNREKDESLQVSSKNDKLSSGKSTPTSTQSLKIREEKVSQSLKIREEKVPAEKGRDESMSEVKVELQKVALSETPTQSKSPTGNKISKGNEKNSSPSETQIKPATKEKESETGKTSSLFTASVVKTQPSSEAPSTKAQLDVKGEPKSRKGSPAVRNGPSAVVSPRSGTRRPPTDSPDPSLEKDIKRRKVEDISNKSNSVEGKVSRDSSEGGATNGNSQGPKDFTPSDKGDKPKAERKREHSSDKDISESKRKKDSPIQPPIDAADIKEKRKLLKVTKKEAKGESPPISIKKVVGQKDDEQRAKKHAALKFRSVRK